jgi:hypothetical protein
MAMNDDDAPLHPMATDRLLITLAISMAIASAILVVWLVALGLTMLLGVDVPFLVVLGGILLLICILALS